MLSTPAVEAYNNKTLVSISMCGEMTVLFKMS